MSIENLDDEFFDVWNSLKKDISKSFRNDFFYEREIWWCSLGMNIGSEQNGKNARFERPVLIVKKYSKDIALVLPLTTSIKKGDYYVPLDTFDNSCVIISQARTVSSKRFLRKIATISVKDYLKVLVLFVKSILFDAI